MGNQPITNIYLSLCVQSVKRPRPHKEDLINAWCFTAGFQLGEVWKGIYPIREVILQKNLLLPGFFPKRGRGVWGVMSESKRLKELFSSGYVWTFFRKKGGYLIPNILRNFSTNGEGFCIIPKCLRNFLASVWKIFRNSGGGGWPDSKDDEEQMFLWYGQFSSKIGGMTKIQTFPRDKSPFKIKSWKSSFKESKN